MKGGHTSAVVIAWLRGKHQSFQKTQFNVVFRDSDPSFVLTLCWKFSAFWVRNAFVIIRLTGISCPGVKFGWKSFIAGPAKDTSLGQTASRKPACVSSSSSSTWASVPETEDGFRVVCTVFLVWLRRLGITKCDHFRHIPKSCQFFKSCVSRV